jgi:hypothetical protein
VEGLGENWLQIFLIIAPCKAPMNNGYRQL